MNDYDDVEAAFDSAAALTGWRLTLLRAAKGVGAIWLDERYQRLRCGYALRRWIDPFETPHLVWALSSKVAHDHRDVIVIACSEFKEWISPYTVRLPGFDEASCFDRLMRELPAEPLGHNNYLRGRPFVCFIPSCDRANRKIVIHVVCRWDRPMLTPGQHHRLMKKLQASGIISVDTIQQLHADALRRNWRVPSIPRPPRLTS